MPQQIYEAIYQRLRENGEAAWTGQGYSRAWTQLDASLGQLEQANLLPAPGARGLELGCGNGAMASRWFALRGYQAAGVDISPTAVAWATEAFAAEGLPARFQQGDVCELNDWPAHYFDLIYDGSCLHCLIGEQRARCYRQAQRLLKRDGVFIVSSMCGEARRAEDRRNYDPDQHLLYREGRPWRTLLPLPLLQDELIRQGFTLIHTRLNKNPWWDHATLCCRLANNWRRET